MTDAASTDPGPQPDPEGQAREERFRLEAERRARLVAWLRDTGAPPEERRIIARAATELENLYDRQGRPGLGDIEGLIAEHLTEQTDRLRLVPGGQAIFSEPPGVPAVWGHGEEVLWSEGERLLVVGPQGVGKTTLAQQLVLARIGVGKPEVLGYPVALDERPVVYVAADRPRQALRSLQRMVDEEDRTRLDEFLLVHKGPLPFDPVAQPRRLADWLCELEAGTLVIDSLKDLAPGLAKDEIGAAINIALQHVTAEEIEILALHHQRKASADNKKPKGIDDVYGSVWLSGGAGSVVLLWGEPGDPIVKVTHLKQPAAEVLPFTMTIDHRLGAVSVKEGADFLTVLRAAPAGIDAPSAARLVLGIEKPRPADRAKAYRRLEALVAKGLAYRRDPEGPREPVVYFATVPEEVAPDEPPAPTQGALPPF